jgi:hypothetical protein
VTTLATWALNDANGSQFVTVELHDDSTVWVTMPDASQVQVDSQQVMSTMYEVKKLQDALALVSQMTTPVPPE